MTGALFLFFLFFLGLVHELDGLVGVDLVFVEQELHDLGGLEDVGLEGAAGVDGGLHVLLLLGALDDALLDGALGDESVDRDLLVLADPRLAAYLCTRSVACASMVGFQSLS